MNREKLFDEVGKLLEKETRLIQLPTEGKVVFVGDTHGDFDASKKVIHRYLKRPYKIVFLGDYVDRGDQSEENINYLMEMKFEHPEEIFLLMGNHESYHIKEFYPANFWESLLPKDREIYGHLFSKLPLCASSPNGVLALHGALPELESLEEVNKIRLGDRNWERIVWGDFIEINVENLGDFYGRPQFGKAYFERIMAKFQKALLIRSHQPNAPLFLFDKRCITIFTSHAYLPIRTVVVIDMERQLQVKDNILIERI